MYSSENKININRVFGACASLVSVSLYVHTPEWKKHSSLTNGKKKIKGEKEGNEEGGGKNTK